MTRGTMAQATLLTDKGNPFVATVAADTDALALMSQPLPTPTHAT